MRRIVSLMVGVFFLVAVMPALAQDQGGGSSEAVPAADHSQIECSGFISATPAPNDLYVDGGADNDFLDAYHAFGPDDYIFLHIHHGSGPTVGQEYRLVRPISETTAKTWTRTGLGDMQVFGYNSWYAAQHSDMRKLGKPYADIGRIKIVKLTEEGVVAQVLFACSAVHIGDLALPYEARPIPTYTLAPNPDRFALTNGKKIGSITALKNDFSSAGTGTIVYINLGQSDNVQPGERFRVVHVLRLPSEGLLVPPTLPDETVGELVVLWTQQKSSVGIVVRAIREIDAGDAIQLE